CLGIAIGCWHVGFQSAFSKALSSRRAAPSEAPARRDTVGARSAFCCSDSSALSATPEPYSPRATPK
ncbi:hypothetical protein HaLaN_08726, partial [Haematococcus lacustris]